MFDKISHSKFSKMIAIRRDCAFSLLSVLALGAVCSAFIAATATSLIPLYREIGNVRSEAVCNSGTSSAIDFLLAQLNSGNRNQWDAQPGEPKVFYLNSTDVSALFPPGFKAWDSNFSLLKVTVKVGSDDSDLLNWAVLKADKGTEPLASWRISEVEQPPLNNWRVLTVEARYGGSHKNLRVVLRPRFVASSSNKPGNAALYLGSIAVTQNLLLGANDGEGPDTSVLSLASKNADVVAFSAPQVNASSIQGNLKVFTPDPKAKGFLNKKTEISQAVYSNVEMSAGGNNSYIFNSDVYDNIKNQPGDVAGKAPFQVNRLSTRPTLPPAPESSSALSSIPTFDGKTSALTLNAGDYSVGGLNVPRQNKISINSSASGPTRLFLSDTIVSDGTKVIDIQGKVNAGGEPSALQIYYNGTGTINIRNDVSAMIYAPNATVLIGPGKNVARNGSTEIYSDNVDFRGAIVARTLAGTSTNADQTSFSPVVGTSFKFDPALARADSSKAMSMGLTYNSSPSYQPIWSSANFEIYQIVAVKE